MTRCSWAKPRTSATPQTDAEKAYGRSLPKPELPDFPIRGYEYYDYRHDVVNTTFRNFEDNATRKTGAISNLLFSSFGVSTNNAFERLKFENAKPVYFPPMAGNAKWASDNGGSSSYKTAAYRDKDGSLGRGPNSFVIIHDGVNDSIAVDTEACEIKPTWNAAVCKGDVGRMNIGGARRRWWRWIRRRSWRRRPAPWCAWRRCRSWRGCRSWPGRCPGAAGAGPGRVWRSWRRCRSWRPASWRAGPVQVLPEPAVLDQVLVVLAQVVVEPAVPVQRLLSRQSFSAAMARTTP